MVDLEELVNELFLHVERATHELPDDAYLEVFEGVADMLRSAIQAKRAELGE